MSWADESDKAAMAKAAEAATSESAKDEAATVEATTVESAKDDKEWMTVNSHNKVKESKYKQVQDGYQTGEIMWWNDESYYCYTFITPDKSKDNLYFKIDGMDIITCVNEFPAKCRVQFRIENGFKKKVGKKTIQTYIAVDVRRIAN